jgi:hypothetical protein
MAAVTYAGGRRYATPKEPLEVLARGHSASVDDHRKRQLDGRRVNDSARVEGRVEALQALLKAIRFGKSGLVARAEGLVFTAATLALRNAVLPAPSTHTRTR